jgi:transcriptional regulator with XRE-family HTH domain
MEKTTKREILEMDKLVGANIKCRRLMLGLTLNDMVNHLGISLQQLGKYEKGLNRVSAVKLFVFSDILKVPIDYFYNQIEESKMLLDENKPLQTLIKVFATIKSKKTRDSIIKLTKAMAKEA